MNVPGQRAVEHAKNLAKPRRTGSNGEKEARAYIFNSLRSMGYKVMEEPFQFQTRAEGSWRGYFLGLLTLTLLVMGSSWMEMKLACVILSAGMLVYGIGAGHLHRNLLRESLRGTTRESANLFATPAGVPCFGPRVLLCAHYDTKSQSVSIKGRIFLITTTVVCASALPITAILSLFLDKSFLWISTAIAGTLGIVLLGLIFLRTHDRSPGAIDNGAAVGILLELAERLRLKGTPHGREIAFLFSGAEEEGLVGAMSFLGEHTGALHERPHQIINLDIVGADTQLYVWGGGEPSRSLENLLLHSAKEERVPLKKLSLVLGAAADHLPFASAKVPAVTLTSPFGVLDKIHTHRDTVELLSSKKMGEIVRLLENVTRSGYPFHTHAH